MMNQARTRNTAQSMVEFALIAPLLFMILFGIIELGLLLNIYVSITNSAREAARSGAVYQYIATDKMAPANAATIDSSRLQAITTSISSTLNPLVDRTKLNVTISYSPATATTYNPYRANDSVTVALSHDHQLFFGLLGPAKMTLRSTSTMRIEPGGTR